MNPEIITPRVDPKWERSHRMYILRKIPNGAPHVTEMCPPGIGPMDSLTAPLRLDVLLPEAHPCRLSHSQLY